MRYMIIIKAHAGTEAGELPPDSLVAEMVRFHEELHRAGMLVDASGLRASSHGWRISYQGDRRTVIDGPFAETKELIAGFTIIEAKSREEALAWTKRFPNPAGPGGETTIEVRPFLGIEDLEPSEAVERFKQIEAERKGA